MRKGISDFVGGGFNDEITYKRTRYIFDSIGLVPRYLADVSGVDTSTTILGRKISLPVLAAPSAPQVAAHPDGDLATCRAVGARALLRFSVTTPTSRSRRSQPPPPSGLVQHLHAQGSRVYAPVRQAG